MKVEPLLKAISTILPAVDSKGLVPEFQFLYFTKNYIEATDGALFIRADLEEEAPEFVIDAQVFHSLLKTIKDKEIEIKVKEKSITVKTKSVKTELALPEKKAESLISFEFDKAKWQELPDGLLEGLALCRYTACPDQTAGPLTGVRVEDTAILSCDRWRVSLFSLEKGLVPMTIPVDVIDQLSRFSDKVEGYVAEDGSIYFKLDGACIGARLVEGEYPTETLMGSLDQVEGAVSLKLSDALKKNIAEAGKRQNIIQAKALEFDRKSRFSVEKGKVKLYAEDEAVGKIEEMLDCKEAKNVEFSFYINPIFLLKMFDQTDTLAYSEDNNIAAFEGGKFMHLVKTKTPEEKK